MSLNMIDWDEIGEREKPAKPTELNRASWPVRLLLAADPAAASPLSAVWHAAGDPT